MRRSMNQSYDIYVVPSRCIRAGCIFVEFRRQALGRFDRRVLNAIMSREACMQSTSGMRRPIVVRNPYQPALFAAKENGRSGVTVHR